MLKNLFHVSFNHKEFKLKVHIYVIKQMIKLHDICTEMLKTFSSVLSSVSLFLATVMNLLSNIHHVVFFIVRNCSIKPQLPFEPKAMCFHI